MSRPTVTTEGAAAMNPEQTIDRTATIRALLQDAVQAVDECNRAIASATIGHESANRAARQALTTMSHAEQAAVPVKRAWQAAAALWSDHLDAAYPFAAALRQTIASYRREPSATIGGGRPVPRRIVADLLQPDEDGISALDILWPACNVMCAEYGEDDGDWCGIDWDELDHEDEDEDELAPWWQTFEIWGPRVWEA